MAKTFCGQKKTFHSSADCILCLEKDKHWMKKWWGWTEFGDNFGDNATILLTGNIGMNGCKRLLTRSEFVQVGIYFFPTAPDVLKCQHQNLKPNHNSFCSKHFWWLFSTALDIALPTRGTSDFKLNGAHTHENNPYSGLFFHALSCSDTFRY